MHYSYSSSDIFRGHTKWQFNLDQVDELHNHRTENAYKHQIDISLFVSFLGGKYPKRF